MRLLHHILVTYVENCRFPSVAILVEGEDFKIRHTIETRMLSPVTKYAAYMIFKIGERHGGLFNTMKAYIRYADRPKTEAVVRDICFMADTASLTCAARKLSKSKN